MHATDFFLPFMGVSLTAAPGVPVHVARDMAKAVCRAWLAVPVHDRMGIRRLWSRTKSSGGTIVAEVLNTPVREEYDPRVGLRFAAGRLRRMSGEELENEVKEHFARAALTADNDDASPAAVGLMLKSWRYGRTAAEETAAWEPPVCPQIKSAAMRNRWGLPPIPPCPVPRLRDPETRRKWGLPELY